MAKKGTKLSEEHKKKISDALRGQPKNYTDIQLINVSNGLRAGWQRRKEQSRALAAVYYVYIVFCELGNPLYVGKGSDNRAFRDLTCDNNQLGEIARQSSIVLPVVVFSENLTEEEAYRLERFLIQIIGRRPDGPLINLARGGVGGTGTRKSSPSDEEKLALAARNRNRIWTDEMREKSRLSHLGQTATQAQRDASSIRMKGNTLSLGREVSEETRKKMSRAREGIPRSEEVNKKIGDSHRGKPKPALQGRPRSEETKRKISETRRIRYSQQRL